MTLLEIFRTGTFTDSQGTADTYELSDLVEIVSNYDPSLHEAPFVLNHDERTANMGLVKSLALIGESLYAIPHKVTDWLKGQVNSGRWPRVSVALYGENDPNNPTPGSLYLRHVSFVQVPAVKGMQPPGFAFAEGGENLKYYDVGMTSGVDDLNYVCMSIIGLLGGLRDMLLSSPSFEIDAVDNALPRWQLDQLRDITIRQNMEDLLKMEQDQTVQDDTTVDTSVTEEYITTPAGSFADKTDKTALTLAYEDRIATLETQIAERDFRDFLKSIPEQVVPSEFESLTAAFKSYVDADRALHFSDSNRSLANKFKESLRSRPKAISFNETKFPAGATDKADERELDPLAMATAIQEKMHEESAKGRTISFSDAYELVHSELASK